MAILVKSGLTFIEAGFGEHNLYEIRKEQNGCVSYRQKTRSTWHRRKPNKQGYIKFLNWCALHVDSGCVVSRSESGF